MSISKSKINSLETCPLLFKFQYLEHRKPDIPKADVTQIGTDIHKIFHDFFDNIRLEEIPEQPYEYFCNSMKVDDRYRRTFNHFCKIETNIFNMLKDKRYFMPVMREKDIVVDEFHGIIDRVDWDGEHYSIIDYKSTAPIWKWDEEKKCWNWEPNPSKIRFELNFYKMIIEKAQLLDSPIEYVGSYGYRNGGVFFEKVNERSYNSMLKKVDAFQKLDFSKMEFTPKYQDRCPLSWCEFPQSCGQWKKQMRF